MNFDLIMKAVADVVKAAEIDGVGERCFGWPMGEVPVPCFIVGYPEGEMNLNLTYGNALVRMNIPAWWVVGKATARTTPDALGSKIAEIKAAIDGNLDGAADTVLVLTAQVEPVSISGGDYLAVRFVIDVVSSGGTE